MSNHQIDIKGLPEGWEPVEYRMPHKGEYFWYQNRICVASSSFVDQRLIVQKSKPRRIVLEETEDLLTPGKGGYVLLDGKRIDYISPSQTLSPPHKIWRIKEE